MPYTTIAVLGGLMGMLGYGISDFFAKKSIDKIGDLKTLLYVQVFGAIFMLPLFIKEHNLPVLSAINILYILIFGFFNLLSYVLLYRAFSKGKVSIISPISSSYAILVAITSFAFFGESFSGTKALFLVLVVLGVFLTSIDFKKLRDGLDIRDFSKGFFEILIFLLINGLYVPFWNRFMATEGWIFWVFTVRLILSILLLAYMSRVKKTRISIRNNSVLLLLVFVALFEVFASVGSSWGYHGSVNASSIVAAVTSAYPLVTVILGYTFLKEKLAINQYIGIGIIIIGLSISPFLS